MVLGPSRERGFYGRYAGFNPPAVLTAKKLLKGGKVILVSNILVALLGRG